MARNLRSAQAVADVEAELARVRGEHERLSGEIAEAKRQQRALAAQMRALESGLGLAKGKGAGPYAVLQAGTIGDATEAVLRQSGQPMRIADLVQELQDAGKLLRTEWSYSTLSKTLARDPRFERAKGRRGFWRLVTLS